MSGIKVMAMGEEEGQITVWYLMLQSMTFLQKVHGIELWEKHSVKVDSLQVLIVFEILCRERKHGVVECCNMDDDI